MSDRGDHGEDDRATDDRADEDEAPRPSTVFFVAANRPDGTT
jgi:hypothetical protein